jgi:hypothetical protein
MMSEHPNHAYGGDSQAIHGEILRRLQDGIEPLALVPMVHALEASVEEPTIDAHVEMAYLYLLAGQPLEAWNHAEAALDDGAEGPLAARAQAVHAELHELAGEAAEALIRRRAAVLADPNGWEHQAEVAALLLTSDEPTHWDEAASALDCAEALGGDVDVIAASRAQLQRRREPNDG